MSVYHVGRLVVFVVFFVVVIQHEKIPKIRIFCGRERCYEQYKVLTCTLYLSLANTNFLFHGNGSVY